MSAHSEPIPLPATRHRVLPALRNWIEREDVFSWLMILPPMAFLIALVGYPFVYGIWLSLENRPVAQPGTFIGLGNFVEFFQNPQLYTATSSPISAIRPSGRWCRTPSSIPARRRS